MPDFNRRFTVKPTQPESAFTPLPEADLGMLMSAQYERTVRNDGTVLYLGRTFQLPPTTERTHYARCLVIVHHFIDDTWGVSHQGKLLAHYNQDGEPITTKRKAA